MPDDGKVAVTAVKTFHEIFEAELGLINNRRKTVAARHVQTNANLGGSTIDEVGSPPPRGVAAMSSSSVDVAAKGTVRLNPDANLTGLALSGGGIRSAAFSLGVLQALNSLNGSGERSLFDGLDYLSTVSGGGYIGASLVNALAQSPHEFPYDSRLDEQETPQVQHLRNYSNFLAPNGGWDYATSLALVLRGFLVNMVIVAPVLLFAAAITVAFAPRCGDYGFCGTDRAAMPSVEFLPMASVPYGMTVLIGAVIAALTFATAIYSSLFFRHGTLRTRSVIGYLLAFGLIVFLLTAAIQIQPYAIGSAISYLLEPYGVPNTSWLADTIKILAPVSAILTAVAPKLANMAKASATKSTWSSFVKKAIGKAGILIASVIVPILLWAMYIFLSAAAVMGPDGDSCGMAAPSWFQWGCSHFPSFLVWHHIGTLGSAYLVLFVLVTAVCLLIGPNANSLHRLYRDRLSTAFLIDQGEGSVSDLRKFSNLTDSTDIAPYFIANTAINLIGSPELNKRGRNADNFIFSPLFMGSAATGYVSSDDMENVVKDLTLGTVMATSGAAASANMGGNTIRPLTFSLSLLNIRLGYWLANPKRLTDFKSWRRILANIGTVYFAAEAIGELDENFLNVYLTDGGHIENLGVYELLRRRCKVIVSVDAEADPDMSFPSFVSLQIMARIDLGIRIDMGWRDISKQSRNVMERLAAGDVDAPPSGGPHVAIGVIRYSDTEYGTLIYIKSSVTGDENDYITDYERKNTTFPHETTIDQFFTEKQFEAYRALGFHAARGFFTGEDKLSGPSSPPPGWPVIVSDALKALNVPSPMVSRIIAQL